MVIKRSVVLAGSGRAGKRELAVADVIKNGKDLVIKVKKGGVAGVIGEKTAAFVKITDGKASFSYDGEPLGIGVFLNNGGVLYGELRENFGGKRRLIEAFEKIESEKNAEKYDDYAIAEENYFEKKDAITCDIGHLSKNGDNDDDGARVFKESENASTEADCGKEKARCENVRHEDTGGKRDGEGAGKGYYGEISSALQTLFYKYPREKALEQAVSGGKFVKIVYSDDKYYVVGTTVENGAPEYVIFGVPAPSDGKQPAEFNGAAYFVPCDIKEKGYYLIYRDAFTGEILSASKR